MYLQFRVAGPTGDCYLCVRQNGQVCYDGKPDAFNTIFKASRVYPPPIDKFQFICCGGPSRNHALYPEGTLLKSKKYEAERDYVTQNTAEPTLLNLEIHNDGEFLISIESREGIVSGEDSQSIKFIPYLAEHFERELAPL
ncbi:uncharacterized protein LOC135480166 [Liolophura sinensis]|uniref:uncharacterized protein LOC135480166 n=1 Tax=Liolophura sinensis TaxID=3198878 RepID=UPI003158C7E5